MGTFVEDATPCTGEPVQWSGGYDTVVSLVESPTTFVRSLEYVQQLTGVGLVSGATYLLNANYHETDIHAPSGTTLTVSPLAYVEVNGGSQPNYVSRELFQFVVDPSGNVVLYGDSEVATCVG